MEHDYDWLRTGSEDLLALVKEKGKGDLRDGETGARYPKKDLMDIYGYLVKKCVEDPWDEDLYGVLRMVADILDIPEEARRKLHTEAMLNPFMIALDHVDKVMLRELEDAYRRASCSGGVDGPEGPCYGINFSSETGSLENLQTSSSVLMEVEKDSIITDMLYSDLGPSSVDSMMSMDTVDRKRSEAMPKAIPSKASISEL
jgi:hypothetical protein